MTTWVSFPTDNLHRWKILLFGYRTFYVYICPRRMHGVLGLWFLLKAEVNTLKCIKRWVIAWWMFFQALQWLSNLVSAFVSAKPKLCIFLIFEKTMAVLCRAALICSEQLFQSSAHLYLLITPLQTATGNEVFWLLGGLQQGTFVFKLEVRKCISQQRYILGCLFNQEKVFQLRSETNLAKSNRYLESNWSSETKAPFCTVPQYQKWDQ